MEYFIAIDTYDKDVRAYCLCRKINNKFEIILAKRSTDIPKFDEEVKNISNYFNAKIVSE